MQKGGARDDAGLGGLSITGIAADSRKTRPGYVFAALSGTRADGRGFIADALARGAVAVLAETGTTVDANVPLITHDNPRAAYAKLAARLYAPQPAAIAAVTGTNGKSSTAEFTRQIWTGAGHAAASLGTLGLVAPGRTREGGLTTPDPADLHIDLQELARSGVDHLAIEASSHGLDQFRLDGLKVSAAAFTNLTRDHLDYHGTMETYRAAKERLFSELLEPTGAAVINVDDPAGAHIVAATRRRGATVLTYGRTGTDLKLLDARPLASGQSLSLDIMGSRVQTVLPLIGEFQAMNALAALGLALGTGVLLADAIVLLATLKGARGRVEHAASLRNGAAVYVDYAHTPDALERVLVALRPHTKSKLAVVFGCGGDRDKGKRSIMGGIAQKLADRVYVTDDNPRSEDAATIRKEVLTGAPGAQDWADREGAIRAAVSDLRAGDILVVAGKGHEQGQIVGTTVLPFDDAEVARRAVREVGA